MCSLAKPFICKKDAINAAAQAALSRAIQQTLQVKFGAIYLFRSCFIWHSLKIQYCSIASGLYCVQQRAQLRARAKFGRQAAAASARRLRESRHSSAARGANNKSRITHTLVNGIPSIFAPNGAVQTPPFQTVFQ